MKRTDFSYNLPPSLIAQEPRERGRSRMMVVTPREGEPEIEHDTFASFPRQLAPGDVLVLNDTRESDRESYQTVYANERGAIAAPTAGLHFTRAMLDEIAKTNEIVRITLHVGIGTFEPVKVDDVAQHVMHSERYEIGDDAATKLNAATSIVAVGTTTVRTLESAFAEGVFKSGRGETNIFITPGYEF